jgi:hypothetical protein
MSKNHRTGNFFRLAGVIVVVATLAGCMKTGSSNNTNDNNVTFITLMHMAPYAPSTEVYFNGDKRTSSIAPGTFSTSYGRLPPGNYALQFKVTGADSVLGQLPASVYDTLRFYTVILFNRPDTTIGTMKINDDYSSLTVNSANYRFFNLCPDAPSVDLYVNTSIVQPNRQTADNYNMSYYNAFQTLAAGGYSLTAKKTGTDSVIATVPSVNLQAGGAYTIFLSGKKGSATAPVTLNVLQASY